MQPIRVSTFKVSSLSLATKTVESRAAKRKVSSTAAIPRSQDLAKKTADLLAKRAKGGRKDPAGRSPIAYEPSKLHMPAIVLAAHYCNSGVTTCGQRWLRCSRPVGLT